MSRRYETALEDARALAACYRQRHSQWVLLEVPPVVMADILTTYYSLRRLSHPGDEYDISTGDVYLGHEGIVLRSARA